MQTSLPPSTLQLLLGELISLAGKLGNHEARLTALERQMAIGSASSPAPLERKRGFPLDIDKAAKVVKIAATAMKLVIWFALHVLPIVSLMWAAFWKLLWPYAAKLGMAF